MEACPSGCIYITNEKIVPFFFLVGVRKGLRGTLVPLIWFPL